ncbi:hypothetical protein MNV49_006744 [Pseudohyphozyma bogoriensis]|nr:hypothetical protein MNV49_006744 [Pseudohyphozyma bogoriensis]
MRLTLATAFVGMGALSANAQLSGLSTSCTTAAEGLLTSGLSSCINLSGLISLLSASGSIISSFDSWLDGACTQTCSSDTLANATSTIEAGCSSDLASGEAIATGLDVLVSNYTEVKSLLCLQATSNSSYCITQSVAAAAPSVAALAGGVEDLITGGTSSISSLVSQVPTSELCTDCNKGLVTELEDLLAASGTNSSSEATSALSSISSTCGSSFTDGTLPSDVSAKSTATSTGGNSAVSSTSLSPADRLDLDMKKVFFGVATVGLMVAGGMSTML